VQGHSFHALSKRLRRSRCKSDQCRSFSSRGRRRRSLLCCNSPRCSGVNLASYRSRSRRHSDSFVLTPNRWGKFFPGQRKTFSDEIFSFVQRITERLSLAPMPPGPIANCPTRQCVLRSVLTSVSQGVQGQEALLTFGPLDIKTLRIIVASTQSNTTCWGVFF
jgi:hypothetical protein